MSTKRNLPVVADKGNGKIAELEDYEKELLGEARVEKSRETLGVPRIIHQSGLLSIDGRLVKDNKLAVVIVDYMNSKEWYENPTYDPKSKATPGCYGFGRVEAEIVPHPAAPKPQHADCRTCDNNRFGTAETGRAKRCKDTRRLMVIAEVDDPGSIQKAEVRQISVPPGSLKNWGNYLASLIDTTATGNVRTVLTEIGIQPGKTGAHELTFKALNRLESGHVKAVLARRASVQEALTAPFPNIEAEEKPVKNAKRSRKLD
jgi:hypothetical protein